MRIFKHKRFQQWTKAQGLKDETLKIAFTEVIKGLHNGNLGGNLYKKRIAMPGKGKRASYRTLLAFKYEEKAFFVYGFAKNMLDNINEKEKAVYKELAGILLSLDEKTLEQMIALGSLIEVK